MTAKNTMDLLQARLSELAEAAKLIENVAASEKRSLTADEMTKIKQHRADFEGVELEIECHEASEAMNARVAAPVRRITEPEGVANSATPAEPAPRPARTFTGGDRAGATPGSMGFRSIGEFAIVARTHMHGRADPRILNAPSSYGQEAVGADGGFAVPPDFRAAIMKTILGEDGLLGRTDQQTTSSNSISLPLDSVSPWDTSNGVVLQWAGEGQALTPVKPKLGQLECKAHKASALVAVTDELLADVPSMTNWLQTKVPEKFTSGINDVIVNGSGVGKPLGLLNAASKITQAAVSGQGAGTVTATNIMKMWSRMYAPCRRNAVWLINQDVEPQLQSLIFPGSSAAFPAYLPPGGLSSSPYAMLLGKPILSIEACQTVGTEGDIILADLTQYLTVMKSGGLKTDVSIHLYFDSGHTAFRFELRLGGQSYWPAPVARQNGSNTLSPIVTLNSTRT